MIRQIRDLLHDQGFTIVGARNKLQEVMQSEQERRRNAEVMPDVLDVGESGDSVADMLPETTESADFHSAQKLATHDRIRKIDEVQHLQAVRQELNEIRDLLNTKL